MIAHELLEKDHNLLIIDDELEITKSLVRQFKRKYNVFSALSAEEGLTIMEQEHIQVVISDQRMPGMTGTDFFSKIKNKYPDALKLLITGYSDIEAVIGAINGGQVFRYIKKPWNPDELETIVAEAFKKYELITKNRKLTSSLQEANLHLEQKVKERTQELETLNKTLYESEEKFRVLLENSGLGVGVYSPDGKIMLFNQKALQNLGGKAEDFVGKSLVEVFGEENGTAYFERVKQVIQSNKSLEYEDSLSTSTGDYCFLSTLTPIKKMNGEVLGVQVISTDISKHETTKKKLDEKNRVFSTLLENLQVGVFMVEAPSGKPLVANEAAKNFLGRGILPDTNKKNLSKVYQAFKTGTNEHYPVDEMPITRGMYGEKSYIDDMEVERPDGSRILLEIYGSPVYNNENKVVASLVSFYDIAERKLSETKLKESELFFRASQQAAHIGSYNLGFSTNHWTSSEVLNDIFGINEDYDKSVQGWSDLVYPEDREMMNRHFAEDVVTKRQPFNKEYRIIRKSDGEVRWVHGLGKLTIDANDNILSMVGTIQDITDRKQIEKLLNESENHFRTLANSGQALIWTSGLDKKCNYFNETWLKFTGRTLEQEIGDGWIEGVHPDDLQHCINVYVSGFDKREKFSMEYRVLHVSGEYRWIQDDGSPRFDSNGEFIGYIGHCLDITERKQIENALRQEQLLYMDLVNTQPAGIYRLRVKPMRDLNPGNWREQMESEYLTDFVSDRFCEITGISRQEFTANPAIVPDRIHPDDNADFVQKNTQAVLSVATFIWEGRMIYPDKGIVWIRVESIPRLQESGEVIWTGVVQDITERKQIENALRFSEEKFRAIFENSIVGKSLTTIDNNLFVNKSFSDIVGYSQEELSKMNWSEFTHKDDIDFNNQTLQSILRGERTFANWEKRYIHKNGNIVWVDVSTLLMRDENDKPIHFITEILDITKRKQAEQELLESEERFKMLFDQAPIGYQSLDESGHFIDVNETWLETFGYTKEDVIGKWFGDFLYGDYKEGFRQRFPIFRKLGKIHSEFEMVHKDGTILFIAFDGRIGHTLEGEFKQTHCVLNDITERRRAEQLLIDSENRFRRAIVNAPFPIMLHAEDGAVELINDEWIKTTGYTHDDIPTIGLWTEKAYGIKKELVQSEIENLYGLTEKLDEGEYTVTTKSGEDRSWYFSSTPLGKTTDGRRLVMSMALDVTNLNQAQEEIKAKNKELESYLYIASHDLRSPLVNIQGFSQRLQKQSNEIKTILTDCKLDSDKKDAFDKITEEAMPKTLNYIMSNVTKMDILINSLLQISRTGRLPMNVKTVDMHNLFKNIIEAHNYQIKEFSATVKIKELYNCYGDENQLNQLFSNLIDNALKYRDKNRKLNIQIDSVVNFNKIIYSISDTGKGINKKELDKIWDVFYRVNPEGAQSGEGIGLSICKTIVTKHKGKIWVESEEGKSTTFYVELQRIEFTE